MIKPDVVLYEEGLDQDVIQRSVEYISRADVLIIGLVSDDGILKDGSSLDSAPFRDDMFTLDEMLELKRTYRIKRIVITHIDEYWGKSYAYYREFEKKLDNVSFAYDGMEIVL